MHSRRRRAAWAWPWHLVVAWVVAGSPSVVVRAQALVTTNGVWKMFKGTAEPAATRTLWRDLAFDDASWATANAPFSYGKGLTNGTLLADMRNRYSTVYLRTKFQCPNPTDITRIVLKAASDDGFVAYLNGREVARYNCAPGDRPFDDHRAPDHATVGAPEPTAYALYEVPVSGALQAGENVLAIQAFNDLISGLDLFLDAELTSFANESEPPRIASVIPAPGDATNLTKVTVTFTEQVAGVDPGDLVLNARPSIGFRALSPTTYEYQFAPHPFGPVEARWIADHGITDRASIPNAFPATATGSTWSYLLLDPEPPTLAERRPPSGFVQQLSSVTVRFSEPVQGVDASDLLVNGVPATGVEGIADGPYVFTFPAQGRGVARITFATNAAITDVGSHPLAFAGASWSVFVDPQRPDPAVRINEVMAANATGLKDEDGEEQPWIELHNFGSSAVNLDGLALADSTDGEDAWVFPPTSLAAGQYLVVFASGKDRRDPTKGRMHTSFRLARDGETVGLFNAESPRRAISSLPAEYPGQRNDIAWARMASGEWAYVRPGTPGATNGGVVVTGACADVRFSVERGYFQGGFEIMLSTPTPGARIRYTLNGSDPNATNSVEYAGPISITRTTVVRANAVKDGLLPSRTATHSYLVGLGVAQRGLPALSIVTATNHLTGPTGIVGMQGGTRDGSGAWVRRLATDYFNPNNRGIAWERPASVELLTPSGNGEFQVDAGLRLHASDWFRPRLTPTSKFSWRLYFRGDYGAGRLRFPLVPVAGVEEYDAVVCRAGSNDLNPFVRDEIMRRLLADCGQVSARGTFVSLFLNGRSSGYYNPVERVESDFLALHHGGGPAWDVMSQSGVVDGDSSDWNRLVNEMALGDAKTDAWYQKTCQRLDVTNFVDYLLVNAYGYTGDWPGNNWRAARERRAGARWRYYIWDAEWAFGWGGRSVSGNTFTEIAGSAIGNFYARLRQHPEFRLLFADRVHRHLFNGGALTATNVTRHFADTTTGLGPLITGLDLGITNTWVRNRPASLRQHLVAQGLFASSNAPVLRQHGGRVPRGFVLTLTNLSGTMWYTLDGSDPRVAFTGRTSVLARAYSPAAPLVLTEPALLRARSLDGTNWSALSEAVFELGDPLPPVRISEVMYQPPGGAEFEFVEVRNLSARPVDVSGFTLDGVELRLVRGAILPAGAAWVFASDKRPASFATRYPGVAVAAWFAGALDNAGEELVLRDALGNPVDRVRFRPDAGWPPEAAGGGRSLERVDLGRDGSDPAAWRASLVVGGAPGVVRAEPPVGPAVRIDEVFAGNNGRISRGGNAPDFVELRNLSGAALDVSGWTLQRADRTNRLLLPSGTILAADARLVAWFGDAAPGDLAAGFRLAATGGVLVLANPAGVPVSTFAYGPQADAWSCGYAEGTAWPVVLDPSPGTPNAPVATAEPARVTINEWLPNPAPGGDDIVEWFNADPALPAFLPGGWLALSNEVHVVRFPVVLRPRGFAVLRANGGTAPDELPFRLPASGGVLRWFAPDARLVSEARWTNAAEGVAFGRVPDGGTNTMAFVLGGTPGAPNVLSAPPGPQFSEVYARAIPGGSMDVSRDWVELLNSATNHASIAGWRIALRSPETRSWTVPDGIVLAPGARYRIRADAMQPPSMQASVVVNTGFALPDEGGVLELLGADSLLRQRLVFGPQIPGRSVGVDASGAWRLMEQPTPGRTNGAAAVTGAGDRVRINEWLAASPLRGDFIELYNADTNVVEVSGWRLTDDPSLAGANRFVVAPLSFIGPSSWLVFEADGQPEVGPLHLPFGLSAEGESVRLYRPTTNLVDSVTVLPMVSAAVGGRFPDGTETVASLARPTPGLANVLDSDLDDDLLPDDWELANGLDPRDSKDAARDADGDGRSNLDEFRAGTDPRDGASVLALEAVATAGGVSLRFEARPGRSYWVQARESWDAPWVGVGLVPSGDGPRRAEMEVPKGDGAQRYFRVVTPAP